MRDALYAASVLHVSFEAFTPEEFLDGINIELEHGTIQEKTNVTNDDLIMTAKIALAHLNEFPNYYNKEYGLRIFEQFLQDKLVK
jgi:hypothetical protein